jgi:predicted aspartyl protease
MKSATGSFDKNGNPILKIKIGGVFSSTPTEFTALIDTGFTGFLSMPLIAAFPLGLPLCGTTSVVLADGQNQSKLMASARVMVDDESDAKLGLVILEPSSTDVLVGMEFLRQFKFGLFISTLGITLFDDAEFTKAVQGVLEAMKRRPGSRRKANPPSSPSAPPPPSGQSPPSAPQSA